MLNSSGLVAVARSSCLWFALAAMGCSVGSDLTSRPERGAVVSAAVAPAATQLERTPTDVSAARLREHINALAGGPRAAGTPELAAARAYCKQKLAEFGYSIYDQPFGDRDDPEVSAHGSNVHGYLLGAKTPSDLVMVSAHLDSAEPEQPSCPGASADATGIAGMLEVAHALAQAPHRRTIVASCWDRVEGVRAYAQRARAMFLNLRVNFLLDSLGGYSDEPDSQVMPGGSRFAASFPTQARAAKARQNRGDFIAVVGNGPRTAGLLGAGRHTSLFEQAAKSFGLRSVALLASSAQVPVVSEGLSSHQRAFWDNGFDALLVTDTGALRTGRACDPEDEDAGVNVEFARLVAAATTVAVQQLADD